MQQVDVRFNNFYSGAKRPKYMDDLDDDEEDENEEESDEDSNVNRNKQKFAHATSSSKPSPSVGGGGQGGRVAVGTVTQMVPDGVEFKTGDFVMLKADAEKNPAPIWR